MNNKKIDQEVVGKLLSFLRNRESAKREGEQFVWDKIMSDIENKEKVGKRVLLYQILLMAATFLLLLGLTGYYLLVGR